MVSSALWVFIGNGKAHWYFHQRRDKTISSLNDKCEDALVAYVQSLDVIDSDDRVFPGKNYVEKESDCAICACSGEGQEDIPNTGNFWLNARITYKRSAVQNPDGTDPDDDPRADDITAVTALRAGLMVLELPALISALADDFTCMAALFDAQESVRDPGGLWEDTFPIRLLCCASDL